MKINIGEWQIRSYSVNDIPALVRYGNNRNIWINLTDRFPFPYTEAKASDWINFAKNQNPETNFAISNENELIGGIGIELKNDVYRMSGDLGFWLGEPFWGKGIMPMAVKTISEHFFNNLNICRIAAFVFEWNKASIRVLEKAGFTQEGHLRKSVIKDNQIIDMFVFAKINMRGMGSQVSV